MKLFQLLVSSRGWGGLFRSSAGMMRGGWRSFARTRAFAARSQPSALDIGSFEFSARVSAVPTACGRRPPSMYSSAAWYRRDSSQFEPVYLFAKPMRPSAACT
ncbi:MAG: hypothetical protein QM704_23045 [Anaeromyxobacteraceae bacterium]